MTIEKPILSDTEETKSLITTSCKDCVFAIWDDPSADGATADTNTIAFPTATAKEEKTQTGCSLGRIEKFGNRGVNIIEAEDEESQFYVVETPCSGYRQELWKIAHEGENLSEVLEQECYPKVGFVIIMRDGLKDVDITINSALEQEKFKPFQILLVNVGSQEDYFNAIEKIEELLEDNKEDVLYKVQHVTVDLPDLEVIDEAFTNAINGYYSVFESGKVIPKDLIKTLNKALNHDVVKIGYVKGFDGINGMTVQCVIHKFLMGNKGIDLEQKLKDGEEYDKVEGNRSLIKTWDELK